MSTLPGSPSRSTTAVVVAEVLNRVRYDLADKSIEKRKKAVCLLRRQILLWTRNHGRNRDQIALFIRIVVGDLCSDVIHICKSALLAVSVCAIQLQRDPVLSRTIYLQSIKSVISIVRNATSLRLVLLGLECLYNLSKVNRSYVIDHFADIFLMLTHVLSSRDVFIRNAAEAVNALIKDVVIDSRNKTFPMDALASIFERASFPHDAYSRNFVLGWVRLLHSNDQVPISLALPSMLSMIDDCYPDVAVYAQSCIEHMWHHVRSRECLVPIARFAADPDQAPVSRQTALKWMAHLITTDNPALNDATYAVQVILKCLDDPHEQVSNAASEVHARVFRGLGDTHIHIDIDAIVGPSAQAAALNYLLLFARHDPLLMDDRVVSSRLLRILLDAPFDQIGPILEILLRIALARNSLSGLFKDFMKAMACTRGTNLEKKRVSMMISSMAEMVGGHTVFTMIAQLVSSDTTATVSPVLIQTLLLVLLLSDSLFDLRLRLQSATSSDLFSTIFTLLAPNSISAIALAIYCRAYELAFILISSLASLPEIWKINTFEQIVQLVELIDSPAFVSIRLDLLDIHNHPYLFKVLYGLLALLPECSSFDHLHDRMQFTSWLAQFIVPSTTERPNIEDLLDIDSLYKTFLISKL